VIDPGILAPIRARLTMTMRLPARPPREDARRTKRACRECGVSFGSGQGKATVPSPPPVVVEPDLRAAFDLPDGALAAAGTSAAATAAG